MAAPHDTRTRLTPQSFSEATSAAVIVIACLVLIGWRFDITVFKSVYPELVAMNPVSAVTFILTALSLWLALTEHAVPFPRTLGRAASRVCAILVALVGVAKMGGYIFGLHLSPDVLMFPRKLAGIPGVVPQQMPPNVALCFALVGLALLLLDVETRGGHRPAQYLTLAASLVAWLVVLGYMYGMTSLIGVGGYLPMALNTGLAFVLTCVGILCARPNRGLMRILAADSTGGNMARRLFPAAIILPIVLGWLRLEGDRARLYSEAFGAAMSAVANTVVVAVLLYWTAASLDRTDAARKKAEQALRESDERFRLLVGAVEDYAIFMLDPRGCVISWNHGAERINGYPAEEIVGQHFSCFYPPEEAARGKPSEQLEAAREKGRVEDQGWRVRKDGSRFWADVVLTAVRDEHGKLRGFAKITRDVTERKRAAEALERQAAELARSNVELIAANKELDAFTYSVSHDLRAPLRHVDAYSKIVLEEYGPRLDPQGQHCLERIQAGAQQMARLVDDLLNLGRVGRQALVRQPVALAPLVREIVAELAPETQGRDIDWQIGELPRVECDPGLIKLVFQNLLSNAVKYTRPQKYAVIQVGQISGEGAPVIFVRDNGIGFNMRYVDRLFGIFQRLHRQEDFEGSGVGLANVQRVIHKHGGRVWAEGEPYKGATFYFTLGTPVRAEPEHVSTPGGGGWGQER